MFRRHLRSRSPRRDPCSTISPCRPSSISSIDRISRSGVSTDISSLMSSSSEARPERIADRNRPLPARGGHQFRQRPVGRHPAETSAQIPAAMIVTNAPAGLPRPRPRSGTACGGRALRAPGAQSPAVAARVSVQYWLNQIAAAISPHRRLSPDTSPESAYEVPGPGRSQLAAPRARPRSDRHHRHAAVHARAHASALQRRSPQQIEHDAVQTGPVRLLVVRQIAAGHEQHVPARSENGRAMASPSAIAVSRVWCPSPSARSARRAADAPRKAAALERVLAPMRRRISTTRPTPP